MYRISRAAIFRFNSKTQWQIFLLLFGAAIFVPLRRTQTWRLHAKHYKFCDTLLKWTREWKTAKTWFWAMLLIYQSSVASQIFDFIHWTVTIFKFDPMTGKNREFESDLFFFVNNKWRVGFNENKEVSFSKKFLNRVRTLSVDTGMHKIHSVRAKNADWTCTHSTKNKVQRWPWVGPCDFAPKHFNLVPIFPGYEIAQRLIFL